jgi:hypothetical protein
MLYFIPRRETHVHGKGFDFGKTSLKHNRNKGN